MLKEVFIANFRSIKEATLKLSKINIFYGGTATGKSSVIYALLVLKNFIKNPSQIVDSLFNLGFINLGDFNDCVFDHDESNKILIGFGLNDGKCLVVFHPSGGAAYLELEEPEVKAKMEISFPHKTNKITSIEVPSKSGVYEFIEVAWNGINAFLPPIFKEHEEAKRLARKINSIPAYVDKIDIVPHRRGFFKPIYAPTPLSINPTTEDEVATIIADIRKDKYLPDRISESLERIANRSFSIYTPLGTSTFILRTTDKGAKTPVNLINDGFGVNQLVYMLAKIHRKDIKTVLIEEPEIHLHPTIIRNLAEFIASTVKEENKQFIIITHSEMFVSSILAQVSRGKISPEDLKIYLTEKEGKESVFKEQKVNEKGQVEGGLESFISAEIEDLKAFLGISD